MRSPDKTVTVGLDHGVDLCPNGSTGRQVGQRSIGTRLQIGFLPGVKRAREFPHAVSKVVGEDELLETIIRER